MFHPPPSDCTLCPRLVDFRCQNQHNYPHFFNGAVPSFGRLDAELLVVGLAPGLKGANQTGRPFTGDYAGKVLYQALMLHGFAVGDYQEKANDGLDLIRCRITNAVRCVPPENKPTPAEAANCLPFLQQELMAMPSLRVVLSLGNLSHGAVAKLFGVKLSAHVFGHGNWWDVGYQGRQIRWIDSYHCSRYNIQTNRLTQAMFNDIIGQIKTWL